MKIFNTSTHHFCHELRSSNLPLAWIFHEYDGFWQHVKIMQICVRSLGNLGFKIASLSAFSIEFCKHVITSAEAILRLKLAKMNDPNNSFLRSRPTQDVSRRVGVVTSEHRRRDVVDDGDDVFRGDGASHDGSADPWAADRRDQQARVHLEVLARVEVPLPGPPGTTHHRILAFRASRHFRYCFSSPVSGEIWC